MTYFHPQRLPELPARRRQAARQQLEQVVARSRGARTRRPPAVIAAVMAVVVLSTGAAAAVATYHSITDRSQARCFTVANADAGSQYFTTVTVASKPASRADVDRAVTLCRALYRMGMLSEGHRIRHSGFTPTRRIPHLVPCVWPDGTAAVFPGHRATCRKLDLQAAAGG